MSVGKVSTSPSGYGVDRIIGHKSYGWNRSYIVKWYRYGPEDDDLELADNIPQHFITCYHRRGIKDGETEDRIMPERTF